MNAEGKLKQEIATLLQAGDKAGGATGNISLSIIGGERRLELGSCRSSDGHDTIKSLDRGGVLSLWTDSNLITFPLFTKLINDRS